MSELDGSADEGRNDPIDPIESADGPERVRGVAGQDIDRRTLMRKSFVGLTVLFVGSAGLASATSKSGAGVGPAGETGPWRPVAPLGSDCGQYSPFGQLASDGVCGTYDGSNAPLSDSSCGMSVQSGDDGAAAADYSCDQLDSSCALPYATQPTGAPFSWPDQACGWEPGYMDSSCGLTKTSGQGTYQDNSAPDD